MQTLDVIVEGAVLLPVLPEEAESIVIPKVLKLDQCVLAIFVHHSLHEFINQIIVCLRAIPLLVQAHVERILKECLIEGKEHADTHTHTQRLIRELDAISDIFLTHICKQTFKPTNTRTQITVLPRCLCQRLSPLVDISQV